MDPRKMLPRTADQPDAVLSYGNHDDALVDVFIPPTLEHPTEPSPLLVLVHGGFWRQAYDRSSLYPMADDLCRRGFVVALPEYRRVGGLGGWPETGMDVEAALAFLLPMIYEVAPGWVDRSAPYVLAGHSAGGQLALWAGLRAGPQVVSRIVALAPVADLAYAAAHNMGDGAAQALLGGEPDEVPDHYAEADPARLLPGSVPITLVQGTRDKEVTVDMNRRLAVDFPTINYVELDGVDHFALIDPLSPVFEHTVLPALS